MKRDFKTQLLSFDGQPFKTEDDAPLTLERVCISALGTPLTGDDRLSGIDKFNLFQLAGRIHGAGEVEVSSEEISTLKDRIAKLYGPFVVGAAWSALES